MRIVLNGLTRRVQLRANDVDGSVTFVVYSLPSGAPRQPFTQGRLEYWGPSAMEAVATAEKVSGVRVPQHSNELNRALYREQAQRRAA